MLFRMDRAFGSITVLDGDDAPVARIRKAFWSERAKVTIGGRRWVFEKDGGARIATCLDVASIRFRAWRPNMWSQPWHVECGPTSYGLHPRGLFTTTYDVVCGHVRVGVSGNNGVLTQKPYVDVAPQMPVDHAVFLLWIAYIMRRRSSAAASSSS